MSLCDKTNRTVHWTLLTAAPTQSSHARTDVPTFLCMAWLSRCRQCHTSIHAERNKARDYEHHATSNTTIARHATSCNGPHVLVASSTFQITLNTTTFSAGGGEMRNFHTVSKTVLSCVPIQEVNLTAALVTRAALQLRNGPFTMGCWYVLSPTYFPMSQNEIDSVVGKMGLFMSRIASIFLLHRLKGSMSRDAHDLNNIETPSCHQVFFSCKASRRRNFTPFWQKH